jgi:transcriptional activator HAC1
VRPAVSVDFGDKHSALPLGCDLGLPNFVQRYSQLDDKPGVLDNLFDFDQFPEGASSMEPTFGMVDTNVDIYDSNLFSNGPPSASFGLLDSFDAKYSDLQNASGATYVCDEALAAEF